MDELVQFLRDRLDEDEQKARAAAERIGPVWGSEVKHVPDVDAIPDAEWDNELGLPRGAVGFYGTLAEGEHLKRWAPARVLAEVEAKRRLLDDLLPDLQQADRLIEGEWNSNDDLAGRLVEILLAPYPKCGARTVFWPDEEGCDAECVWPRGHGGTRHMDETLGSWDEADLHTSYPSE